MSAVRYTPRMVARFFRMRRAIDALGNEATRLNLIVLDTQRDPQVRRKREPEIDAAKQHMRQLLEEIFQSMGLDAESDAPFEPRRSMIPDGLLHLPGQPSP